ncbi:insulin-induced protein-domain-containing protein [Cercophora newfieldiana]|uniref:Insulin-induced protein-domain-containing protein n=1 Tax=Cercophora newfieldiana TaxID=92897 RepID=A0AA39Y5I5_9PEZI|nr:insulin-induced protein-domain-containing protein [Cercophora newfieldiana]
MDSRTGEGEGDPGPRILRPIPRRPFNLNFTSATPPDEDSAPTTPQISANDLRFLDPRYNQQQHKLRNGEDADSLSRVTSFMNLTSSTLFGIYAPTTPGRDRPGSFDERADDLATTPWGTGAETPAKPAGVDEETYKLMKDRSSLPRRTSSYFGAPPTPTAPPSTTPPSRTALASFLLLRAALLFALGMGYGVLVTRLPTRHNLASFRLHDPDHDPSDIDPPLSSNWHYLTFWGLSGIALGSLLPWFDRVWEDTFGPRSRKPTRTRSRVPPPPISSGNEGMVAEKEGTSPEADWALVVRGIGAFVGIVFAIRKLPWTSTMQVSLTLALANPFLWYLIDRSKPGFLLSAAVGVAGSAVLMGLNPDVMPAPTGLVGGSLVGNGTQGARRDSALGGFASQETVETGIWMLSVLFCSCVCFGNIGRRLALNSSAAGRGRWGGVR